MNTRVLISDDEQGICHILRHELEQVGFVVSVSNNGKQTKQFLDEQSFDVLLLDIQMPGCDGFQVLDHLKTVRRKPVIIMMTAYGSIESAVKAMQLGASDYITKPFDVSQLLNKINRLLPSHQVLHKRSGDDQTPAFWGSSPQVNEIRNTIEKIKNLKSNVLITGESGTGKGVVAKAIHFASNRAKEPFVHVDCGSIQPTLIESILFGHEKGAFTGAVTQQKGKFELAGEGTLFLDEIGTLSLSLQSRLLVVLQERQFSRVGGVAQLPVKARIIAATNEHLEDQVREGKFREDLYYRLNIIRIHIPPLRERLGDVDELAQGFLHTHAELNGKNIRGFDDETVAILHQYEWPGNVRELENAVECAVAMAEGPYIKIHDIPTYVTDRCFVNQPRPSLNAPELSLSEQEMMSIINALEKYGGHREKTAAALGISRRTLQYKLKKYGLINTNRDRPQLL